PGQRTSAPDERARDADGSADVDDFDESVVVAELGTVDEREALPVGRDANTADPAGGFVEDLPDRILEAAAAASDAAHGQPLAVRRPVGVLDVLEDLARRAASEGDAGEGARRLVADHEVLVKGHGELARRGDSEQRGARQAE